jgi:hypothetical protein
MLKLSYAGNLQVNKSSFLSFIHSKENNDTGSSHCRVNNFKYRRNTMSDLKESKKTFQDLIDEINYTINR